MIKNSSAMKGADSAEITRKITRLVKLFDLSSSRLESIIRQFGSEMDRGLAGEPGSLKMIPAYVDRPTGEERGTFVALDLGGTNLRILGVNLKGKRKTSYKRAMKFVLDKRHVTGSERTFFDFLALSLKKFVKHHRIYPGETRHVGFTFSFPVRQTGVSSGSLVCWTKGFDAKGVVGKDVVKLLEEALKRKGVEGLEISALANDTVGTLAAGAYLDPYCDVGVIIGTGTNACYPENLSNIPKWDGPATPGGRMIVNIEWGNFNKLISTPYDRRLDRESDNPARQILEKMVSGMYLGGLVRLVLADLVKDRISFKGFKTEHMSAIEADTSRRLEKTGRLLRNLGVGSTSLKERRIVRMVCNIVSRRAARIVASCIGAIILKMDPRMARRHTVAIDGSVYEKHPAFARHIRSTLRELFGKKSSRIKIALTKDGSGFGAAIIAAIASRPQ